MRLVFRALAHLPLGLLHAVGSVLGWLIHGLSPTYRRHLHQNLAQAGIADARVRREAIAAAGKLLMEAPAVWFRPHDEVIGLVKRVDGEAAVRESHARGEAIVFLTPHLGCFEVTAQFVAQYTPITVLYRPPNIGWLEPLMQEGRERPNVRLVPADVTGVREVMAALRRKEPVGFLPDQVPGEGEGEWTEFFGRPAYTMTFAAKLAEREGNACFLAYGKRLPRGAGYEIVVRPLPPKQPGESAARHVNRALENLIRECPGQYLWGYNRYKTPRGAKAKP